MNYFEKKQWIRLILCAVVVLAVALLLIGIIGGEHLTYNRTETTLITEKGFGGDVTLHVSREGNILRKLTIDTPNETEGLGKKASGEDFTSQFLDKEGPFAYGENEIEAISGATVTSDAVLKALNRLYTEEKKEEAKPETAETTEKAAPEAAEGTPVDITAQGFGGDVTLHVTLDGKTVTALAIDTPNETAGLGQKASEEAFTSQFIGKEGPFTYGENGIEAITGATVTSTAVLNALNGAISDETPETVTGATEKTGTEANSGATEKTEPEKTEPTETPSTETVKAEVPEGAVFAPGTYEAEAQGLLSTVKVSITVNEQEITGVDIDASGETETLGGVAAEMMGPEILKAQTPNVDMVSGATVTSTAIIQAATEALKAAGADIDALDANRRDKGGEAVSKEEKTIDTEVVVIGAGGAGMTAAIMLQQAGKDFVLLEKMPYAGGNTTKATGGMNAAETHYQKEQGIEDSVELFAEDTIKGGHDLNNPELVNVMAKESAGAIDWLDSIGAELPKISFSGGASVNRIHAPADGSGVGEYLVEKFSAKLAELGVEIMYNTAATELLTDADGRICGVKAEGKEYNYIFNCKSVILATGGFGANEEMYTQYRPDLKGTVTTNAPGATGDGIVMAQAVGADLVDIEQIQLHPTVEQSTSMLITESVRGDGAILVNQSGVRFTNELLTRDAVSAAELEQEGCYAYIIFDQNLRDHLKAIEKYVKTGITVQADTIEGLAEQLNIDPAVLAKTLADWNECVKNQNDPEFGRTTGMEADLTTPPYYAIKIAPGIHHTMGGVKIDTAAHVINTEGQIIPGLYAAGEVTGGVHGGNRLGGNAVADIVIFGRIAAETAVSELGSTEAEKTEEPAAKPEPEEKPDAAAIPGDVLQSIMVTMGNNSENNIVTDYLEQDPYLVNIYEGFGFAKDYGSARGHSYTLEDVSKTQRPHPKANCITCKTDDFARMVNSEGIEVYSRDFDEVMAQMKNTISCYTCHGDGMGMDGQPAVTHSYVNTALGDAVNEINPAILACGQCHIEYYFTPDNKETMMPYHNAAEMTPEAILAYYDAMDFADWTQEATGTKMLKAQHPETETVLNSGHYAATGMTCADCHMPAETTDSGNAYKSHYFVSPLQNETLLNNCARCHGDAEKVTALVKGTQEKVTGRETEVGNKLSALKDALAAAAAEGKLSEADLDAVRKLHREAQWYFDFCYVENSEGAHNSKLSLSCLETSEGKIDEAMAMLTPAE